MHLSTTSPLVRLHSSCNTNGTRSIICLEWVRRNWESSSISLRAGQSSFESGIPASMNANTTLALYTFCSSGSVSPLRCVCASCLSRARARSISLACFVVSACLPSLCFLDLMWFRITLRFRHRISLHALQKSFPPDTTSYSSGNSDARWDGVIPFAHRGPWAPDQMNVSFQQAVPN